MRLFSRHGYSHGLVRHLGLEIPDGGETRATDLSFNLSARNILAKMVCKSGFAQSAIFWGYGEYLKASQLYSIPIADARDLNGKPSEGAILLYNIYQNRAELHCLYDYRSEHFPIYYGRPIQKQLEALTKESSYLADKAKDFNTRRTCRKLPAVASIVGMLVGLAITAIAGIVMYLLYENWLYLSHLDPFHHVVVPIAYFGPPLLLVGLPKLRNMCSRMLRRLARFKKPFALKLSGQ